MGALRSFGPFVLRAFFHRRRIARALIYNLKYSDSYMGVGKKGTRNATELPFLEISPKPTTTSAFRSRPRHDGPFVALGVRVRPDFDVH